MDVPALSKSGEFFWFENLRCGLILWASEARRVTWVGRDPDLYMPCRQRVKGWPCVKREEVPSPLNFTLKSLSCGVFCNPDT